MLEPPDWDKKKIVEKVENKYGVSAEMVAEVNVRVRYGDTEESIVKRVLGKYQEKIIKDT
jgi:transcriptional regulator